MPRLRTPGGGVGTDREAARLEPDEGADRARFQIAVANGERVWARAVVIASGATYRRFAIEGLARFEGAAVHYRASPIEAKLCADQEVALVDAGNSAGQAAVYLASGVVKVWMLVRGRSLEASTSRYLVDRIAGLANVEGSASSERTRTRRA